MDFHLPDDIEKLRIKTKQFVDSHIIPLESDKSSYDDHENINLSLLNEIKKASALKNYYILSSIFSQILSLLILLILFRHLLLNIKKRK